MTDPRERAAATEFLGVLCEATTRKEGEEWETGGRKYKRVQGKTVRVAKEKEPAKGKGAKGKPTKAEKPTAGHIARAMLELDAQAASGAMVSLPELRERFAGLSKEEFDAAVIAAAHEGNLSLQRHEFPRSLTAGEKADLVTDGRGNYFAGIGARDGERLQNEAGRAGERQAPKAKGVKKEPAPKAQKPGKATPEQVHDAIKRAISSGKAATPEYAKALGGALAGLTVPQVKELRAKLGLTKGTGAKQKLADELVAKVGERMKAGVKPEPKPEPEPEPKPELPKPQPKEAPKPEPTAQPAKASAVPAKDPFPPGSGRSQALAALAKGLAGTDDPQAVAARALQQLNDNGRELFCKGLGIDAPAGKSRTQAVAQFVSAQRKSPSPPEPGFTGTDALGREWVDGKLVKKQEEPAAPIALKQKDPDHPVARAIREDKASAEAMAKVAAAVRDSPAAKAKREADRASAAYRGARYPQRKEYPNVTAWGKALSKYNGLFAASEEARRRHQEAARSGAAQAREQVKKALAAKDPAKLAMSYGRLIPAGTREKMDEGAAFVAAICGGGLDEHVVAGASPRGFYRAAEFGGGGGVRNEVSCTLGDEARSTAHEIGHLIETRKPGVREKIDAFLEYRFGNEKLIPRSQVTGDPANANEMVRKDDFDRFFPKDSAYYVGRSYTHAATGKAYASEILAMGVQALYLDAAGFVEKDPEYAQFVISCLKD